MRQRPAAGTQSKAWRALPNQDGKHQAKERKRPEFQLGPSSSGEVLADATSIGQPESWDSIHTSHSKADRGWETGDAFYERGWAVEPNVGRVADGVAARVDRLKAIGNGQVPLCAASAWSILVNEKTQ
jgi:transposase